MGDRHAGEATSAAAEILGVSRSSVERAEVVSIFADLEEAVLGGGQSLAAGADEARRRRQTDLRPKLRTVPPPNDEELAQLQELANSVLAATLALAMKRWREAGNRRGELLRTFRQARNQLDRVIREVDRSVPDNVVPLDGPK